MSCRDVRSVGIAIWYRYQSMVCQVPMTPVCDAPVMTADMHTMNDDPGRCHHVRVMDIGGSHVTAATVCLDGCSPAIQRRERREVDGRSSAEVLLQTWADAGLALVPEHSGPAEWSIAIPGPFDFAGGIGDFEGVAKFSSLTGLDLRGALAARLRTSPERVRFVHDAVAYGVGEWTRGAAVGHHAAVCITLGTGVGSVFLKSGDPVRDGRDVPPNGYVHQLLHADSRLEDTVSSRALQADFARVAGAERTVKDIAQLARVGDLDARDVISNAMTALGFSLAPWLQSFSATIVVVGGSISRSWDVLEGPLRAGIAERLPDVGESIQLKPSQLMDDAPLIGAAEWVKRH